MPLETTAARPDDPPACVVFFDVQSIESDNGRRVTRIYCTKLGASEDPRERTLIYKRIDFAGQTFVVHDG